MATTKGKRMMALEAVRQAANNFSSQVAAYVDSYGRDGFIHSLVEIAVTAVTTAETVITLAPEFMEDEG